MGAAGALLVILSNGSYAVSSKTFVGDMLMLTNAVMYAAYLVWTKPLMAKYDSITVMRWMFLYGSIFIVMFGGWFLVDADFGSIPPMVWLAIVFIVFGATFLTYLFNMYGLRHVNPTTVSVYIYLQPIVASVLAVWIKHDSFTWLKALSMVLVFGGVYFVSWRKDQA
jgi:drug/metabolite transporter (DMT)-like permease